MFYPNCSNTGFSLLIYYSTFYTNTTYCISVTSSLINRPIINLISSSCCLFTVSSAGPVCWRTYHVPAPRYCPVINTAFASDWPNLSTDFSFFLFWTCVFIFVHFLKKASIFTGWNQLALYYICFTFHLSFVLFIFFFIISFFFFIFNLFFWSYLWFIFLTLIFVHR